MIVPVVSRSAQRGTSGIVEGSTSCFARLEASRETRRCDRQPVDVLSVAACVVAARAEKWVDVELYGRSGRTWLSTSLALPNGIPSCLARAADVARAMGDPGLASRTARRAECRPSLAPAAGAPVAAAASRRSLAGPAATARGRRAEAGRAGGH